MKLTFISLATLLGSSFVFAQEASVPRIDPVPETTQLMGRGIQNKDTHEVIFIACVDPESSCHRLRIVQLRPQKTPVWLSPEFPSENTVQVREDLKKWYKERRIEDIFLFLSNANHTYSFTEKNGWAWSNSPLKLRNRDFSRVSSSLIYYAAYHHAAESEGSIVTLPNAQTNAVGGMSIVTLPNAQTNAVGGMSFVKIPSKNAIFTMGSGENGRGSDEVPHKVAFTYDFEMQTTPITQAQWQEVMGSNPSHFKGANLPVERISWEDLCGKTSSNDPWDCGRAEGFVKKMNDRNDGCTYRLPTEAEWEFAARGGSETRYWFGDESKINDFAWYAGNSGSKTHEVGKCPKESGCANRYGLYDMAGNVSQWVMDWRGAYPGDITYHKNISQGPSSGDFRVVRGGSWGSDAQNLRSANRNFGLPDYRYVNVGARLVRICQ